MTFSSSATSTLALACLLVACTTSVSEDDFQIEHRSKVFSGTAGSLWTEADIRSNRNGLVCPTELFGENAQPMDLIFTTRDDGVMAFSGRCIRDRDSA